MPSCPAAMVRRRKRWPPMATDPWRGGESPGITAAAVSPKPHADLLRRRNGMKANRLWSMLILAVLLAGMVAVPSGSAQTATAREETLKIAIDSRIEDPTNFNITNW